MTSGCGHRSQWRHSQILFHQTCHFVAHDIFSCELCLTCMLMVTINTCAKVKRCCDEWELVCGLKWAQQRPTPGDTRDTQGTHKGHTRDTQGTRQGQGANNLTNTILFDKHSETRYYCKCWCLFCLFCGFEKRRNVHSGASQLRSPLGLCK